MNTTLSSLSQRLVALCCATLLLVGCGESTTPNGSTVVTGPFAEFAKDIELLNNTDPIAIVETDQGTFAIELYEKMTPNTVRHFGQMVGEKRYEGSSVYNVANNFAVYLGDKSGNATEDSTIEPLALETHPDLHHDSAGVVGFVHQTGSNCVVSGNREQCLKDALNSARSFFYITLAEEPSLDNIYAPFGRVVKGLEIVKNLKKGNKIKNITIVKRQ
jgi:cyclophilin family peptidyl-prolyl cis-trans isomerase